MNNELPLDYLHRHVESYINDYFNMPHFSSKKILQDIIKEQFDIIKLHEKFLIVTLCKKVADHWGMTTVPIDSIEKFYHENFTKPYDENKVTNIFK